jgi:hypothetical protein
VAIERDEGERAVRELPRWARVAFAARCARRIRPLLEEWSDLTEERLRAVEAAIEVAERAAARAAEDPEAIARAVAAEVVAGAIVAGGVSSAAEVARIAVRAARHAGPGGATDDDKPKGDSGPVSFNEYFERLTADDTIAAASVAGIDAGFVVSQVYRDLDLLLAVSAKEGWTDETPVPAEFFGPMWPEGAPKRWPEIRVESAVTTSMEAPGRVSQAGEQQTKHVVVKEEAKGRDEVRLAGKVQVKSGASGKLTVEAGEEEERLVLRVQVGEFAPEDEVVDELVRLCRALSAYHIACGGNGLVVDDWQIQVPEREPAEVQ